MKTKLKNADVAKTKGSDYVKKCLKKRLTEEFAPEGEQFLYDAEFDYGKDNGGVAPLLFVGELSSEWRKYIKENKTKATLAGGRCLPSKDDSTILNMEVKIGKGGKQKFLKEINKELLKPFAKSRFVDSILTGGVIEDDLKEEDPEKDPDMQEYTKDATLDELIKESEEIYDALVMARPSMKSIIDALKDPLSDLSKTVVSDQLISTAKSALLTIGNTDLPALLNDAKKWLTGEIKNQSGEKAKDLLARVEKIKTAVSDLEKMQPDITSIEENIDKLQKVAPPGDSDVAPVNANAGKALESSFNLLGKQFGHIAKYGSLLANITNLK